jgi:RNA polymerase sigma factor (TIGR02999 family)
MSLLYDELRAMALGHVAREPGDNSLQPTDLVHEAYLRLADQRQKDWQGRTHFMGVAAMAMRRVLVDRGRRRRADKRGGHWERIALSDVARPKQAIEVDLLDLIDALEKLAALNARHARIVELRYFGGLSVEETAEVLGVSARTVKFDWRLARAWLLRELGQDR